jgi:type II secretory pathway component PulC
VCDYVRRKTMKRVILISMLIVFGSLTGSPFHFENPEIDACGSDTFGTIRAGSSAENIEEDVLVIYLEEVQEPIAEPGIEQFFSGNITVESSGAQNTDKSDRQKKDTQQELIKVRTKLKCVESILKKAVIKSYRINDQIEGLQINGLDKISEAKALLLKSGDIILAVNGQTVDSKKEAYNIFKKARKEPIMIIELLQDGEAKKLLFDFRGAV